MRYYVQIVGTYTTDGYVEAESDEEAQDAAREAYHQGYFDADGEVGNLFISAEEDS